MNPTTPAHEVLMTRQGQLVLLLLAVLGALWIIRLIAKKKLTMGFGLFWLSASAGFALLVGVRPILVVVARYLGTMYPDAAIRLLAFVVIVGVLIQLSIRLSQLTQRLEDMAQSVALLEHELKDSPERRARESAG